MATHKPDIGIGIRAAEELHRVFPNLTEVRIVQKLGLERKSFWCWRNGGAPSCFALQGMRFAGCDIDYILTGRRMNEDEEDN